MGIYGDRFNAAVAAELRGERAKQRITIDALVAATGYAKTTVLNYLNGKRDIPLPALAELCRVLGVDPRRIFERAEQVVDGE
ncbi:helix-turn-helix domain-containing protein [Microbacterium resistens]|uniref:Helix-turn-helix domain-containing protein n=1 Tax=Microbacterium resistens TaxID=156977 RepID=A0ABY3RTY6_9MICO|nr:helix-turn-helix transcriptional regulator [Microbacterium resistens]UGS26370.1 helix-turn-helix domain-containing protein [Microbacterium resistens]